MSGNCNSGRKPRYLTIERFNKFLANDFFHMKVEVRAQSAVLAILLILMAILLARLL